MGADEGSTRPPSGDGPIYKFLVYVFEDEKRWHQFQWLVVVLGGLSVVLAGMAVAAMIYAPAATTSHLLTAASVVGAGTTAYGGVITYRESRRRSRAEQGLAPPRPQDPAPDGDGPDARGADSPAPSDGQGADDDVEGSDSGG